MEYPVVEVFRSLQGEGHFVGYPMVFVRLAGCSVRDCHIRKECDEAPWKANLRQTTAQVIEAVRALQFRGIACVTGGEPTDHDLLPLICSLKDAGYQVHLETSGVRSVAGMPIDWLTVSPKVFDRLVQRSGHTLKLVVRPEWSLDEAWDVVHRVDEGTNFFHRYLQPMTRLDGSNDVTQVVSVLLDERNIEGRWALSHQAHKTWSVR